MNRPVRTLLGACILALLSIWITVPAMAAPFGPCANAPEPVMPRTGAAGLVSNEPAPESIPNTAPDPFADPSVAIADVYGWSWQYTTYDLGCGTNVLADAGWTSSNHTANFLFGINTAALAILDGLERIARGSSLDWLTHMAGTIAGALAPLVAVWLPITIALLGLWVAWQARRSSYQDAMGSVLIALAAIGVSAIAFTVPDGLARAADTTVRAVQTTAVDTFTPSGSSTDLIVRESLYRSWLVGQFGDEGPTAREYGPRLFAATHYTWSDVKGMRADPQAPVRLRDAKQKAFTALATELEKADPAAYTAFKGRTDRAGPAVLAGAVGTATGVFVWTCLAMLLLCRILMQALAVTVPLMAVVGVLPTGWGFLQSAWDRFTAALIGVAKFTLASGIMTIVLGAVMAAPMSTPEKLLWILLLSIVGFAVTKPFYTLKTITPGLDPNVHYLAKAIGLAASIKWLTTDPDPEPEQAAPAQASPPMPPPSAIMEPLVAVYARPEQANLASVPFAPDAPADHGGRARPMPPGRGPRTPSAGPDGVIYPTGVIVQAEGVYQANGRASPQAEYIKLPEPTLDEHGRVRDDLTYRPGSHAEAHHDR